MAGEAFGRIDNFEFGGNTTTKFDQRNLKQTKQPFKRVCLFQISFKIDTDAA